MSKVIIAGDAVVVTSSLSLEDIRLIKKYRPDALVLKGGEDGKEPIFALDVTSGCGEINSFGASFGRETRDEEKLASITMCIPAATGDVKEWVADRIGGAIMNLNKLEAVLPDVLDGIAEEKAAIMESITVAQ